MFVFVNPFVDAILGLGLGFAVYVTATNSWWTVPLLIRRLRDVL